MFTKNFTLVETSPLTSGDFGRLVKLRNGEITRLFKDIDNKEYPFVYQVKSTTLIRMTCGTDGLCDKEKQTKFDVVGVFR